ncbi:SDR family oxidoreductase [Embleya sp. NPDC050493]|uniref:SDR family oxidoreductase n=1 Tax=Embleya sp. NPDC050493 TaxID=3363989 RepID=UPI00379E3935
MIGKVAVVTGAGSGVGRACAFALIDRGRSVGLAGRRKVDLEETAAPAGARSRFALPVPTDITDPDAVDRLFAAVVERFGRLDLLFDNATDTMAYVPTEDVELADWRRGLDSIATGGFLCARAAFRIMKEQQPRGGRIINNGAGQQRRLGGQFTVRGEFDLDRRGRIRTARIHTRGDRPLAQSGVRSPESAVRSSPSGPPRLRAGIPIHRAGSPVTADIRTRRIRRSGFHGRHFRHMEFPPRRWCRAAGPSVEAGIPPRISRVEST